MKGEAVRYILMLLLLSGCHEYLGDQIEGAIDGTIDVRHYDDNYHSEVEEQPWVESEGECLLDGFDSIPLKYYFAEADVLVLNMMIDHGFEERRECYDDVCYLFEGERLYKHHLYIVDDRTAPIATCVGDELILAVFEDGTFEDVTEGG